MPPETRRLLKAAFLAALLLIILAGGAAAAEHRVTQTACGSMFEEGWKTPEAARAALIAQSRKMVVWDLIEEAIGPSSVLQRFARPAALPELCADLVQVHGLPQFYNGEFGDLCVRVEASVSEENLLLLEPRVVSNTFCTPHTAGSPDALRESTELRARLAAVRGFDAKLIGVPDAWIPSLLHDATVESSGFTPDKTYCTEVRGIVYPMELLIASTLDAAALAQEAVGPQKQWASPIAGMRFVYIPPGTFVMGSPKNEPGRSRDETQHQVTISHGFYMQIKEVTQGQWRQVMGEDPPFPDPCGFDCPVNKITFDEALAFVERINARGPDTYRLPTEAEWEYACRAGSFSAFANGPISPSSVNFRIGTPCPRDPNLDAMAWYCANSDSEIHLVGQKVPNAWGLYDMHGNVWEWVQDWYDEYPKGDVTDPTGPASGSLRIVRGGCWANSSNLCRSAKRASVHPDRRQPAGLRLVRVAP